MIIKKFHQSQSVDGSIVPLIWSRRWYFMWHYAFVSII